MSNEITETIQREIQQAQQPLLERIGVLERELDTALDYICVLNTLSEVSMMNIPLSSARSVADQLQQILSELSEKQKTQAVIHGLANWFELFEHQADALEHQLEERCKLHQWDSMES